MALPFSPLVTEWFIDRFGSPTEAQELGWPAIASGRDALIAAPTDPTPVAALVDRLGPAEADALRTASIDPTRMSAWIFTILCLALLAEWASRRLRGAR